MSSMTISESRETEHAALGLNACCARSAMGRWAPYSALRRRGWHATVGNGRSPIIQRPGAFRCGQCEVGVHILGATLLDPGDFQHILQVACLDHEISSKRWV